MNTRLWGVAFIVAAVLTSQVCLAASDIWLDTVVSFDQPTGSNNTGVATNALGLNDGVYVSVDIPETLILAFTDNTASDGPGADLQVYQVIPGDSNVDIYGSQDNMAYVYLGRTDDDVAYDLSSYPDLDYVNFLKFVGLDNGGGSPGYDLDAVAALNSVDHITPSNGAIPAPGAILLATLGTGLVGGLRRRRTL